MTYEIALLYGIIQGVGEFLPISSSGHLALLPFLFHFEDPGVFFDLLMHVGTAMSLIIYFKSDIQKLLAPIFTSSFYKKPNYLVLNMMISVACSVLLIFLIKNFAEQMGRFPMLIGFNLIFFGFILWIVDRRMKIHAHDVFNHKKGMQIAAIVGFSQAIALFPGVSRSGITLTAARLMGVSRQEAARFSFLLSLPIILAGALMKTKEWLHLPASERVINWGPTFFGMLVAMVVGIFVIHYFLKLLNKISFAYFFIYRFLIGGLIIFLAMH